MRSPRVLTCIASAPPLCRSQAPVGPGGTLGGGHGVHRRRFALSAASQRGRARRVRCTCRLRRHVLGKAEVVRSPSTSPARCAGHDEAGCG
jgi:hypothetical protein